MKNSLYKFLVQNTGKEIEEVFKKSGMERPVSNVSKEDFYTMFGLVREKGLISDISLIKFSQGTEEIQKILFSFRWGDEDYEGEIYIVFSSGVPKFYRYGDTLSHKFLRYDIELFGIPYNFSIPLSNYSNYVKLDNENSSKSMEDLVKVVRSFENEINYWTGYYINLISSGKVFETWNNLFYQKLNILGDDLIKYIFECHIRYLVFFDRRNFDIPSIEELWIIYFHEQTLYQRNKTPLLERFLFTNEYIEEKEFRDFLQDLINERKSKLVSEKRFIEIQKEFYLETMKLKQEISGKYKIDPGWLRVNFPDYSDEKSFTRLSLFLPDSFDVNPYNLGYYKSKEMSESDTREGLNKIINENI